MSENPVVKLAGAGRLAITDAQVHVWNRVAIPGREHRNPPFGVADLLREMQKASVNRAVLIPPSWSGDGNAVALDAAEAHPRSFGVVGRLALDDPAFRPALEGWTPRNRMLGFRLLFNTPQAIGMLHDGSLDWVWPVAVRHRIPLMVLAQDSNDVLERIAIKHPRLQMTIDHLGITRGSGAVFQEGIERILALAQIPNIAVKATALPLYSEREYPHLDVLQQVRRVIDAFTADRVFWGTDLTRLRCSYRDAVEMMGHLEWRDEKEVRLVMGDAILSWIGWQI